MLNIVEQLPNLEQLFLNSLKGNGVVEFEGTKNPNLKFSSMSGEFTGVDKIIFKNFIFNQMKWSIRSIIGPLTIEIEAEKLDKFYNALVQKGDMILIDDNKMDTGFGYNGINVEKDKITIKILEKK